MANHSLTSLQKALDEEKRILDTAIEDVEYHQRMLDMRKKDAQLARHHISDLEISISELESKVT